MANKDLMKDDSIDLTSMLRTSFKSESTEAETTPDIMVEEEKSPIDEMEEAAANHDSGFKIQEENEETGKLRSTFDSDERREEFEQKKVEMDSTIEKAKRVVVVKPVTNEADTARMMDEVDAVKINDDGSVEVPDNAEFIVPKTPEIEKMIQENKEAEANGETPETNEPAQPAPAEDPKGSLVKIIIDKTGLGNNIEFDEEEKKVLQTATEIHLVEIEDQDIATAEYDRPEENVSFMQMVDQYQLSTSKAPMIFPASGFKADMVGLPWGDFAAITLDTSDESTDYLNFDKLYRKFSVIYNHMTNISVGAFKDFEDFLKKFAFTDVQFATYGLVISTQPEEDTLSLKCNAKNCGKPFSYKYTPRSIIDFTSASKSLLEDIDKVADAKPENRIDVWKNARVNKFKIFKIPGTDIIFELGHASCWDYLYGLISLINDYQAQELSDDDPKWELATMLMGLRAIRLKKANGRYDRYDKPSQIVDILLRLKTEEVSVIRAAYEQYVAQHFIAFRLKNIECPHCHHLTEEIQITPDELVFQIYQHQRNTGWQFDNFHDF